MIQGVSSHDECRWTPNLHFRVPTLLRLCAYLGKAKRSLSLFPSPAWISFLSHAPVSTLHLPCVATCDVFIFPLLVLYQAVPSSRIPFLTTIAKEPRNFKKDRGLFALHFEGWKFQPYGAVSGEGSPSWIAGLVDDTKARVLRNIS